MEHKILKSVVQKMLEFPIEFPWEVQGLGFMRLYLGDRAQRLHIWDSSIKVYQASSLHTHHWDINSTVVAGIYKQHRYKSYDTEQGYDTEQIAFKAWGAPPRKYNQARIQTGPNAKKEEQSEVWLSELPLEVVHEGFGYKQERNEIHCSIPEDGTVTLIDRTLYPEPDGHGVALSLWRGKGPWVSAAPRPATEEEILRITRTALDSWF